MKKMKKLFCLVLVVCFAFSMVIASNAAVPTTDHSKSYDIKMYMIGGSQPQDADKIMDAADKYLKDKINVDIKFTVFDYGDFPNKMSVKCAANEKFDIMFTSYWTGATQYSTLVSSGYIIALNDLMEKYAPKTKAILGDKIIKGCSIGGKLYAIPAMKEMAHNWQLIYRSDIAKELKLNMSSIKTLADAEKVFKTVKAKKKSMYPFQSVAGESSYRVLDFEKINGDDCPGAIYSPVYGKKGADTTKVVNDFATPEAMQLFKLMNKWYKLGFLRKDSDTVSSFLSDITSGKTFSIVQSGKPGKAEEMTLQTKQPLESIDITPVIANARDAGTGSMMAISRTSSDPARAMEFLEILNSDKYMNNLMVYGIEGKHFKFVDEKKGIIKMIGDGYARNGSGWATGNQYLNYVTDKEDPEKWAKFKVFNDKALPSPLPLFTYNPKAVKTQVASLTAVKKQYVPLLETGKGDPAKYVPIMNAKFKANGLTKVLADMQKQVDKVIK